MFRILQEFLNNDYVSANKICSVFTRWEKMSSKQEKLSDRDKKILVWGLTELTKFIAKSKMDNAIELKTKWKRLGESIAKCQEDLQELRQKWVDKVEKAEKIATFCNVLGTVLITAGVIGGVVAAVLSAPAWVPYAAVGGGIGLGAVIIGAGQAHKHAQKGIKNKIEDMQKYMKSYEDAVQDWVEAIKLLDFPLGSIAFGGKEKEDYQEEIDSWEKIAEHERDLLKTAAKTFTVFRDQSLESLDRIRNVQRKLQ